MGFTYVLQDVWWNVIKNIIGHSGSKTYNLNFYSIFEAFGHREKAFFNGIFSNHLYFCELWIILFNKWKHCSNFTIKHIPSSKNYIIELKLDVFISRKLKKCFQPLDFQYFNKRNLDMSIRKSKILGPHKENNNIFRKDSTESFRSQLGILIITIFL